nr:MAG TPA: hypothetical protein [Caudoviricetes sp.]
MARCKRADALFFCARGFKFIPIEETFFLYNVGLSLYLCEIFHIGLSLYLSTIWHSVHFWWV